MPIEVRELVIKATITEDGNRNQAPAPAVNTNNNVSANEEIITACVEKVLEILKEKNAR